MGEIAEVNIRRSLTFATTEDAGAPSSAPAAGGAMAVRCSSVALRRPIDSDDASLLQQRLWLVLALR